MNCLIKTKTDKHIMMGRTSFLKVSIWFILGLCTLSFLMSGCTKYPDPAPFFEKFDSSDIPMKRKVLMIVVDGMSGPEIKKIQPPFMTKMLQHSKYSWKAMADLETTDAATWESLMTGYSVSKHQIRDSSFEVNTSEEEDWEDKVVPAYPTFLKRINAKKPAMKTYAASPWQKLNEKVLANVDKLVNAADDEEVKDSTIAQLQKGNSDLLIADFHEVNMAGRTDGFSANSVGYKKAVLKVDDYVKDLVEAVKKRPDYKDEQWLVILTSNHGGTGKRYGKNTVKNREILTAYYNPHFKKYEVPGIPQQMGVQFHSNTAEIQDKNKYDIKATGDYTVMLRIYPTDFGSNNPAFLTKSSLSYGAGNHQWTMMFTGGSGKWRAYLVSTTGEQLYLPAGTLSINEWHTLTLKINEDNGKREASVYTDGEFNNDIDITGYDFSNDKTLKLGGVAGFGGGSSTETIHDVRIWTTALSDDAIDSLSCNPNATPILNQYKNDLIGYWPGKDGAGDIFKDQSGKGNDFVLSDYTWDLVKAFEGCKVDETVSKSDIDQITNFDIPVQIFYWLRVNVDEDWDWPGNKWMNRYEKEFYKKQNTE